MNSAGTKPTPAPVTEIIEPMIFEEPDLEAARQRQAQVLRLLWSRRRTLFRAGALALAASTLLAFLIPKSYTSTAQLMPPDSQSSSGIAMLASLAAKGGAGGLAGVAGDVLGLKSSGALFIGILRSETAQDRIIQQFNLQKVYAWYGQMLLVDARKKLDENTAISEDRKSGIISISITDHNAQRSAAIANAYVDQLNSLAAELSTSAAHRERVFLEDRLKVAKIELDNAANALAQFSSKNNTLDIQTEGRAMLDAAGTLAGQLIAAESELEGLRQIYTENNSRVKELSARVAALRQQLGKLGGVEESNSGRAPGARASATADSAGQAPASNSALASGRVGNLPFPTIRNLPLLGAKYADYYRQAKIQETVFELLTEQFELAKVEEAKETPSVKTLDPGRVPEKKSFPPRLLIMFLGTFLAVAACVVLILGQHGWEQTDSNDPRKALAQEMLATFKANAPWAETNGSEPTRAQKIWSRLNARRPAANAADAEDAHGDRETPAKTE